MLMYNATEKMTTTIHEYLAVKAQIKQLNKAAEDLETKIKAFMDRKGIDEMTAGDHEVTYKPVTTSRLDTATMKKDFDPDVLDMYVVRTTAKRFSVK